MKYKHLIQTMLNNLFRNTLITLPSMIPLKFIEMTGGRGMTSEVVADNGDSFIFALQSNGNETVQVEVRTSKSATEGSEHLRIVDELTVL